MLTGSPTTSLQHPHSSHKSSTHISKVLRDSDAAVNVRETATNDDYFHMAKVLDRRVFLLVGLGHMSAFVTVHEMGVHCRLVVFDMSGGKCSHDGVV
jgi:hypothetical protein